MEFERSMFRVHEKLLKGNKQKCFLWFLQLVFFLFTVFSFVTLSLYHRLYVDSNSILKPQIEDQLRAYLHKSQMAHFGQMPHKIIEINQQNFSYLVRYSILDESLYDLNFGLLNPIPLNYSDVSS
jgi:uncharacterized membrane protein